MNDTLKPRAWLLEPKVQRHPGRHLIRSVRSFEPTEAERQNAELDGDVYVPLYSLNAAVAAERERCIEAVEGNFDGGGYGLPPRIAALIVERIRGNQT